MRARRGGGEAGGGGGGGAPRGLGPPFYLPAPRRKTSAEIISEARAAIFGDTNAGSGASLGSGALRPLPTRRPYTPRDPQRTLFAERAKRDTRPPSSFSLKYLSAAADCAVGEGASRGGGGGAGRGARVASLDEDSFKGLLLTEPQPHKRKQCSQLRTKARSLQIDDPPGGAATVAVAGWAGFPKLPHLSGHSKPLHRRKHCTVIESKDEELATAITITRPLGSSGVSSVIGNAASPATRGLDGDVAASRRRQYADIKSRSDEIVTMKREDEPRSSSSAQMGSVAVKRLAVQLPSATLQQAISSENPEISPYRYSVAEFVEELTRKDRLPIDHVPRLLEALYAALQAAGGCENVSQVVRESVLRALYCHVDSEDERILVGIARIMLAMRVTGGNLSAACKLIFKVARNDKNDHLFKNNNLLELLVCGCGRACPLTEGECCVYGAGALRFLALEPSLRALAVSAGALHLAALHLKILNNAKAESPRSVSEQSTHALYQLSGAVRNLAGGEELREFLTCGLLQQLTQALYLFITDRDIVTNVTRTLSVVSTDAACCAWLCASAWSARALVRALCACASHAPLAVRLAYTLGNMAAASETARLNIYSEPGAVDVLLTVLETQLAAREGRQPRRSAGADGPDSYLVGSDLAGSDGSSDDVLVKTVRVLANLCLAERAGRGLAATHADRTLKALLACCSRTQQDQIYDDDGGEDSEVSEELATAALATINNLTFYHEVAASADVDPFSSHLDELCQVSCEYVSLGARGRDVRAACEAVRALGNVTRAPRAARLAVAAGVLDALEPFLQHEEVGVRCGAAGVLVNVCGAGAGGGAGAAAARGLAAAARARDTHAAALLARALWNAQAHIPLSPARAAEAALALGELIDDDSVFAACEACDSPTHAHTTDANHDSTLHNDDVKQVTFGHSLEHGAGGAVVANGHSTEESTPSPRGTLDYCEAYEGGEGAGCAEGSGMSCECATCARLAAWEQLLGVAIPLLDKLRPPRADASVGTD